MTMYQPNIPTGLVPLNQDYQNIQDNFTQINTTYNTDHIPLTDAPNNGYHTVVHLVKQSPGTVGVTGTFSLYEELTDDGYNTRQQLFAISGTSTPYALTRNFVPNLATLNGSTFLPGGLVMIWSNVTAVKNAEQFVTFGTAFPNNCFNIQATLGYTGGSVPTSSSIGFVVGPFTTTGFFYKLNTTSAEVTQIRYVALGN